MFKFALMIITFSYSQHLFSGGHILDQNGSFTKARTVQRAIYEVIILGQTCDFDIDHIVTPPTDIHKRLESYNP